MEFTNNIPMSNKIFDTISNRIYSDFPNACILWIDEINNEALANKYKKYKEVLEEKNDEVKELQLFHGTKINNIENIINNGFKLVHNVVSAYGLGTYMAPSCKMSLSYTDISKKDISYVFLCDCVVGKCCIGRYNKPIDDSQYDTQVNIMPNSTIYSFPNDDSINPRYLIAFHKNAK
jgi:hypothetical protein